MKIETLLLGFLGGLCGALLLRELGGGSIPSPRTDHGLVRPGGSFLKADVKRRLPYI